MTKFILRIVPLMLLTVVLLQPVYAQSGKYGDELSNAKAIKATALPAAMQDKETLAVKVEGEVLEVCQSKGCWMTVDTGNGNKVRVTFKDYSFFVPKDIVGKKAVFEGVARVEEVDVATLKHYAEDAGKSEEDIAAITEPETKITFVASGVMIED